jgi:hypothetical protein
MIFWTPYPLPLKGSKVQKAQKTGKRVSFSYIFMKKLLLSECTPL